MEPRGITVVVKLGGSLLDDEQACGNILDQLAQLRQTYNHEDKILLVHGGGKRITQALEQAGIKSQFHKDERQRITNEENMDIIEEIVGGEINKRLGSEFEKRGCQVIYGEQLLLMKCEIWKNEDGKEILGSRVGKIIRIEHLLPDESLAGKVAVIAPIGCKNKAKELNCNINADWAAAKVAAKFEADRLLYLTDQDGILDKNQQLMPQIKTHEIQDLIDNGVITDGMIPKVHSMRGALTLGVKTTVITNGRRENCLIEELEMPLKSKGTRMLF